MSRENQSNPIDLNRIVFIGRTFEEYMSMFSLSVSELKEKRVLDCPSGACSFTAIANQIGADVTGCDIAYAHNVSDLKQKGLEDIHHAMRFVESEKTNYVWDYFKNIEELKKERLKALDQCCEDMSLHPDRYVPATLPRLPFKDGEFDMTLSAHFLFMYADRLPLEFHLATIKEFLRVTNDEIRMFPIVDVNGQRYKDLDEVKKFLLQEGCQIEEVKVPYEFQRNAHSMLKIKK